MRVTPYSSDNAAFSNRAHLRAQELLYPKIFGLPLDRLSFESTLLASGERGNTLDGEMAIDRIVKVSGLPEFLRQPIVFTVQERFRRPEYAKWKDVTFTEWNTVTNLPSELYKITANIFLYGYYDEQASRFVDAIALDVQPTLRLLCNGKLTFRFGDNPRSHQTFVAFEFHHLHKAGCIIYWQQLPELFPAQSSLFR